MFNVNVKNAGFTLAERSRWRSLCVANSHNLAGVLLRNAKGERLRSPLDFCAMLNEYGKALQASLAGAQRVIP